MSQNYFAVGEALVKRLAGISELKAILTARDIQDVEDNKTPAPAVMVLFAGEAPAEGASTSFVSDTQIVAQRWLVELVISNASAYAETELAEAGYLIARILEQVQGWTPDGAIEPFRRLASPAPQYRGNISLYALAFETLVLTQQG